MVDQDGDVVLLNLLFQLVLPLLEERQGSQHERRLLGRVVARVEDARRYRFDRFSETLYIVRPAGCQDPETADVDEGGGGTRREEELTISSARMPPAHKKTSQLVSHF